MQSAFGIEHGEFSKGYGGALKPLMKPGESTLGAAKRVSALGGGKKPQLATPEMRDNVASLNNQRKKALGFKY